MPRSRVKFEPMPRKTPDSSIRYITVALETDIVELYKKYGDGKASTGIKHLVYQCKKEVERSLREAK